MRFEFVIESSSHSSIRKFCSEPRLVVLSWFFLPLFVSSCLLTRSFARICLLIPSLAIVFSVLLISIKFTDASQAVLIRIFSCYITRRLLRTAAGITGDAGVAVQKTVHLSSHTRVLSRENHVPFKADSRWGRTFLMVNKSISNGNFPSVSMFGEISA